MSLLLAIALAVLGSVLASFIAVVAERHNTGQSWIGGRSECNSCATPLTARDLVPVFSWLSAGGQARCCGARVTAVYAAGETVLGALFALSYLALGMTLALPVFLSVLVVLMFIVLYDLRHTVVPTEASLLLFVLSLGYAALSLPLPEYGPALLTAGIIGLGFFLLFALSRGRAMGLGDAPVALSLSVLVGPTLAIPGLLFSFWIGAVVGIAILVSRPQGHRMGIEVPFVPFLAAGYLLAFFTQWNPLLLPFS